MQAWLVKEVDFAEMKDDGMELEGKLYFKLQKGKLVKVDVGVSWSESPLFVNSYVNACCVSG